MLDQNEKQNNWLINYAKALTSQNGEDGIIAKILEILPQTDKWCVEFGAGDGEYLSNTNDLIWNKNYSAVLIEANDGRYADLAKKISNNNKVQAIKMFVGYESHNNLDFIFSKSDIPKEFDFISIDIDGNDYHIWDSMKEYKPKVVCIEYNPTIPDEVEFIQPKDMSIAYGNSILSLCKLAKTKGYELICVTRDNAIFVDSKYYDLFNIKDNSLQGMNRDKSLMTYLFTGFDGSTFITGNKSLIWHNLKYDEKKFQHLPKFLRKQRYNKFENLIYTSYWRFLALKAYIMKRLDERKKAYGHL